MIQTLIKNWWLLALCGAFDAILSFLYLVMQGPDGTLTFRTYAVQGTVGLIGKLTLAAGVCTIAAGIWRSRRGRCWLLVLNGLALSVLGLILNGMFGFRISLRTIALLIAVTAMSTGILELVTARTLGRQRRIADEWFFGVAGAVSLGFALAFSALGFHWIRLERGSHLDFIGLGSFFGFSAICMLWLALCLGSRDDSEVRAIR